MTMLDEEVLRSALRHAAEDLPVTPDAAEQLLTRARDLEARPRLRRRRETPVTAQGLEPRRGLVERLAQRWAWRPKQVLVAGGATLALVGIVAASVELGGGSPTNSSSSSVAQGGVRLHSLSAGAPAPASPALPFTATTVPSVGAGSAGASTPTSSSAAPLPAGAVGQSSKVEESGSVDLTVGKSQLQAVLTKLMLLANANGGFVATSATQSGGGSQATASYGSVTLQIPEASFADVLSEVQTFGTVTSLSSKGTDVTGQYVDLQSRITALQASRDQYLTIMSKASSIGDILSVQNQLDTIQSQIEQLQGQLAVLDNQTTYGTLAVSITERGSKPPSPPQPASGIGDAWRATVHGFVDGFEVLVRIAGPLLFVLLCLLGFGVLGRIGWRAARRRVL